MGKLVSLALLLLIAAAASARSLNKRCGDCEATAIEENCCEESCTTSCNVETTTCENDCDNNCTENCNGCGKCIAKCQKKCYNECPTKIQRIDCGDCSRRCAKVKSCKSNCVAKQSSCGRKTCRMEKCQKSCSNNNGDCDEDKDVDVEATSPNNCNKSCGSNDEDCGKCRGKTTCETKTSCDGSDNCKGKQTECSEKKCKPCKDEIQEPDKTDSIVVTQGNQTTHIVHNINVTNVINNSIVQPVNNYTIPVTSKPEEPKTEPPVPCCYVIHPIQCVNQTIDGTVVQKCHRQRTRECSQYCTMPVVIIDTPVEVPVIQPTLVVPQPVIQPIPFTIPTCTQPSTPCYSNFGCQNQAWWFNCRTSCSNPTFGATGICG